MSDLEQRGGFEHGFNRTSEDVLDNSDKRGQTDNRKIEVTEIARERRSEETEAKTRSKRNGRMNVDGERGEKRQREGRTNDTCDDEPATKEREEGVKMSDRGIGRRRKMVEERTA